MGSRTFLYHIKKLDNQSYVSRYEIAYLHKVQGSVLLSHAFRMQKAALCCDLTNSYEFQSFVFFLVILNLAKCLGTMLEESS